MKILPIVINNTQKKINKLANATLYMPPIPIDAFIKGQKRCEAMYKSLGSPETFCKNLSNLLANTQVDLAKVLLRTDPQKAIKKIQIAISIFDELRDEERLKFARMLLRIAKENLYGDKYLNF